MKKIIDFHVHTFPEKIAASALEKLSEKSHIMPFTDGTLGALSDSMKKSEISFSVLMPVATKSKQVVSINDNAIKINSQANISGIFSFGAMHPDFDDFKSELERISEAGIKGIKLHPLYQGIDIDDEKYLKIFKSAQELNLIIMLHAGWDIGFPNAGNALPEKILNVIRHVGDSKIILAHMGGWKCWHESEYEKIFAEIKKHYKNIFIDTAFSLGEFTPNGDGYYKNSEQCRMLSAENFVKIIKNFGAERVVFGTDSPWASQKECVKDFYELPLSEHEKNLILYENAAKILKISD